MDITYSKVYQTVITEGKMEKYLETHAQDIFHHGTHELVQCVLGGNYYWINLDVTDDLKTPQFHLRVNSDNDLTVCDTYHEAFQMLLEKTNKSYMDEIQKNYKRMV